MAIIKLLSEEIINKIAAGEVIERPASVVKELIENSLDAGAGSIRVEIKNSGQDLIKVTDDGQGMDEEDARNSILPHATSKLASVEDLYSLQTLGFRGEALASIAAVSQLAIITKPKGKLEGFNLVAEGGSMVSCGIIAADQGTTVEVRNLFYNTPARKKFLKTEAVELRHIIEVLTHYALFNNHIAFKLIHDNHQLINSPALIDMRDNMASIYGIGLAKDLLEVNYKDEGVIVSGYVAKPSRARNDKSQQALFVNGRWVKNNDINKAVYEAFHSLLMVGKHPIFVLSITINPQKIDVNVHPQKLEFKFEQTEKVFSAAFNSVRESLQRNNLIPIVDEIYPQFNIGLGKNIFKYNFERSTQTIFPSENNLSPTEDSLTWAGVNPLLLGEEINSHNNDSDVFKDAAAVIQSNNHHLSSKEFSPIFFPSMKILGQIHKTFFAAETEGGVFFLDQHAVHERILYEKFMNQFMNSEVKIQSLLQGEIINFTPAEKILVLEHKTELSRLGFNLEEFGDSTFVIKTVPLIFGRLQHSQTIQEVVSTLLEKQNSIEMLKEEIITRMACRAAVMAGEELTVSRFETLVQELSLTRLPYTCPHGRPSLFKITSEELEKKFKRRG